MEVDYTKCFAYPTERRYKCAILTECICKYGKPCKFFKTLEQVNEERAYCKQRAKELGITKYDTK